MSDQQTDKPEEPERPAGMSEEDFKRQRFIANHGREPREGESLDDDPGPSEPDPSTTNQ